MDHNPNEIFSVGLMDFFYSHQPQDANLSLALMQLIIQGTGFSLEEKANGHFSLKTSYLVPGEPGIWPTYFYSPFRVIFDKIGVRDNRLVFSPRVTSHRDDGDNYNHNMSVHRRLTENLALAGFVSISHQLKEHAISVKLPGTNKTYYCFASEAEELKQSLTKMLTR